MRHTITGIVLAVSVVGGVAAGVAVNAATSDQPSTAGRTSAAPATTSATASARPVAEQTTASTPGVEVKDPVLVSNTDGTATLSATLINRTTDTVSVNNAWGADQPNPMALLSYPTSGVTLEPGKPVAIGATEDTYRVRTRDRVDQGLTYRIMLEFAGEGLVKVGAPPATFDVSVVPRTKEYDTVANNGPSTVVTVTKGIVVVVPGQDRAYIDGRTSNPTGDGVIAKPTAIDSRGRSVAWNHQTATGGPSGIAFANSSYLDDGTSRDVSYFLAKDVTVGDTIMVTFQYGSGDVVAPFRVLQGNADGTI